MEGRSVVENVNMKAYVQATRHLVYVLFDSLIANHREGEIFSPTVFALRYDF
jgi:DNA repair/transcription protein MET18/MMS19